MPARRRARRLTLFDVRAGVERRGAGTGEPAGGAIRRRARRAVGRPAPACRASLCDTLCQQLRSSLGPAYTIEREIGGAGMSRVFVARDASLGRDVVVKVLAPELAAGLSAERFTREIRLAAALQQANILPVHVTGATIAGVPYYTMPFVEGESLRDRLARGPLAITEAVSILRDVARALAYAHARGVVHRDIKPGNILLSGGAAVVTDFGIAKALGAACATGSGLAPPGGALTGHGTAIGTLAYMAPEQAAADPAADHRIDLYAFGCLAYELLAGVPPFHGLAPRHLLAAHMGERPRRLSEHRPDVPAALAGLVARCLEKDPAARPASSAELLYTLDLVASGGAAPAAEASMFAPGWSAGVRRSLLQVAGAVVAAVVRARRRPA